MENTFSIDEIIAKNPKVKNGQEINNTQKRKLGIEKLSAIEYQTEYNEEQKNAILRLKKALAGNSMKSYQQIKLFTNEVEDIKSDLAELSEAIANAKDNEVMDTVLKLYLSA